LSTTEKATHISTPLISRFVNFTPKPSATMKKLLFTLLCAGFIQAGSAQVLIPEFFSKAFNTKEVIQKNKIKKELIYTYSFTQKRIKDSTLVLEYYYDSLGDMIKCNIFEKENLFQLKKSYQYNSLNKIFKIFTYYIFPRPGITIDEYSYDSSGKEQIHYSYDQDTIYMNIEKKIYNEKNQLAGIYFKSRKEDFYLYKHYFYTANGDLSMIETYDTRRNLERIDSCFHDKNASTKKCYKPDKEGKRIFENSSDYDSIGRCIKYNSISESFLYRSNKPYQKEEITYHPRIDEYTFNPDGTLFDCKVLVDNKKNRILRHYYIKN
jgi:hypothetical protein